MIGTRLAALRANPFAGANRNDHPDLRRIPAILLGLGLQQIAGMVGTTSLFLVGSILLVELAGGDARLAGLPTGAILLASAAASWPLAALRQRRGTRVVLALAAATGTAGGLLAAWGAWNGSIPALVVACVLVGIANAGISLGRYAAAELAPAQGRGRAMSVVMTSATVGALGSPLLAKASMDLAGKLGVHRESGAFLVAALAYGTALLAGWFLVSREPSRIAQLADWAPAPTGGSGGAPVEPAGPSRLLASIGSLVFAQVSMVFLMAVTPSDMKHCHHAMGEITAVITVHFLGMFGLSFLTGQLVDRVGRIRTIALGSAILGVSCLAGLAWTSLAGRLVSLFLLGLGWNFCFLAGSVLVADALRAGNKARLQGGTDALVSLSSSAASLGAGLALQAWGFGTVTVIGLVLGLAPLGFLAVSPRGERRAGRSPAATAP